MGCPRTRDVGARDGVEPWAAPGSLFVSCTECVPAFTVLQPDRPLAVLGTGLSRSQ